MAGKHQPGPRRKRGGSTHTPKKNPSKKKQTFTAAKMSKRALERKQDRFLASFELTGIKTRAARDAKTSLKTVNKWLKEDPVFSARYALAEEAAIDAAEEELRRRAIEGVDHPVTHQGEITDTYKKYSDNLLMFMLKGARPEKYRDNVSVQHAGKIEGGAQVIIALPPNGREMTNVTPRPEQVESAPDADQ